MTSGATGAGGGTGPQGLQGVQGEQGDQGDKGGLRYTFGTNINANATNSGQVRFNNTTFASIDRFGIHNTDADGNDLETYINTWDDGGSSSDKGIIVLKSNSNSDATFATFRITATNNSTDSKR